jgi:hypothetical protein
MLVFIPKAGSLHGIHLQKNSILTPLVIDFLLDVLKEKGSCLEILNIDLDILAVVFVYCTFTMCWTGDINHVISQLYFFFIFLYTARS